MHLLCPDQGDLSVATDHNRCPPLSVKVLLFRFFIVCFSQSFKKVPFSELYTLKKVVQVGL
jgi:hypothetical protein